MFERSSSSFLLNSLISRRSSTFISSLFTKVKTLFRMRPASVSPRAFASSSRCSKFTCVTVAYLFIISEPPVLALMARSTKLDYSLAALSYFERRLLMFSNCPAKSALPASFAMASSSFFTLSLSSLYNRSAWLLNVSLSVNISAHQSLIRYSCPPSASSKPVSGVPEP